MQDRRQRLLGRRLHRSSLRTAAWASSPTSSATTSDLPDLYDTVARRRRTRPGSGRSCPRARTATTAREDIGSKPVHMGAWEKFQLGWPNYEVASAGAASPEHKLGPAETNTKQAQGAVRLLPDKRVTTNLGARSPGATTTTAALATIWTTDDRAGHAARRAHSSPRRSATRSKLNWDYAYVIVSIDGGQTWTSVPRIFRPTPIPTDRTSATGSREPATATGSR